MSELQVDVECVEEASLLGVFIILVIMVLIPVRARAPSPCGLVAATLLALLPPCNIAGASARDPR